MLQVLQTVRCGIEVYLVVNVATREVMCSFFSRSMAERRMHELEKKAVELLEVINHATAILEQGESK